MHDTPIYSSHIRLYDSVQHVFPAHWWTKRGSH